ncbi:PD-(D/E)XK nuclease-like domain-containing protein, partial [Helicobacter rodentium]
KIGEKDKDSASLKRGSYAHALLFEPETIDGEFGFYCGGKGAKEREKEIKEAEKTPILDSEKEQIDSAINALKESEVYSLFKNCEYEVSCFKEYKEVLLKCKIDALGKDYILDLKTTSLPNGANPNEFAKSCANYWYYTQAAHYMRVTGISKFLFVVLELNPPYMIGLYSLDIASLDFGFDELDRAIEIYKNLDKFKNNIYIDAKDFSKVRTISLPNYVYYKR